MLIVNATAACFFGKNSATAPQLSLIQPLFGGESRLWGHKRSKGFKSSGFPNWTLDGWGGIRPAGEADCLPGSLGPQWSAGHLEEALLT